MNAFFENEDEKKRKKEAETTKKFEDDAEKYQSRRKIKYKPRFVEKA